MQKKLLITVSDNTSYLHGARFVGSFFRNKLQVSATLFYVAPHAGTAGRARGSAHIKLGNDAAGRKRAEEALHAARKMLCDRGFSDDNVTTKLVYREFGTVKDILREAKKGAYDAVVLGRRGYMLFESVFSTSVTKEILDRDIELPIWICRHPEESRRNVLLCVDGSTSSLRMVDHVGFMLQDEGDHSITLFHVDTGEEENTEAILAEARKTLMDNWLSGGRIESVVAASPVTGVGNAILEMAQKKAYAAVGVGRVGIQKGRFKEWLVGSRTMKLLETLDKAALWVSG